MKNGSCNFCGKLNPNIRLKDGKHYHCSEECKKKDLEYRMKERERQFYSNPINEK